MKNKKVSLVFRTKKSDGKGGLIIEGFANRSAINGQTVVDRGKEVIRPEEWRIKEFLANPIIFFNHDRDFPIGRALSAEITPDGLKLKVWISNSKNPEISRVRDLIEEGILQTFSVGIEVGDEEEINGVFFLKDVNLLETSVVSIPMNQESFFGISKSKMAKTHRDKLAHEILETKGAWVASKIHERLYVLQDELEDFNRADALQEVARQADVPVEDLFQVLAGNTVGVDDNILDAVSNVLAMDRAGLDELNQADINQGSRDAQINPEEILDAQDEQDGDGDSEELTDGSDEELETEDELLEEEEEENMKTQKKANKKPEDNPEDIAEGKPEEMEDIEEENENKSDDEAEAEGEKQVADSTQAGENDVESEEEMDESLDTVAENQAEENAEAAKSEKQNVNTESFQACVSKHILEAMASGKDQDEAISFALSKCRDDSTDGKKQILSGPEWQMIHSDIEKFMSEKNAPIATIVAEGVQPSNPMVDLMTQNIAMMGQLIGEVQKLQSIAMGNVNPAAQTPMGGVNQQLDADAAKTKAAIDTTNTDQKSDLDVELLDDDVNEDLDIDSNYREKLNSGLNDLLV